MNINEELLMKAKRYAANKGITLTSFVESALAAALTSTSQRKKKYKLQWKTRRGETLAEDFLGDRNALYDLMEDR